MKALIVLLAVLLAVWLWRSGRQKDLAARTPPPDPARKAPDALQEMVCCPVCGVHLPQADAVTGRRGLYCSPSHRQQAEG